MSVVKSVTRILILFFLANVNFIAVAQSNSMNHKTADSLATEFSIDNCINEFSNDKIVKTDAGYQYWFIDKNFLDGRTLKMSVVAPNKATHDPHSHPEDEIFFILEGKADLFLNGVWKYAGPNTSFYCPPGSTHGIRNGGDSELKYLVIKKYIK
ncbi:MAG: cupin domain-containing protein [Melioribacteraceae bacterium]